MGNVIFAGRDGRPSMKGAYANMVTNADLVVRRRLPHKEYYRVYKGHNSNSYLKVRIGDYDFTNSVIIRWGNRIEIDTTNSIVYNQSKAIADATDKKKARLILHEAGVRVPKMVTLENVKEADLPIICRPFTHAKGKNFIILNTIQEFKNHYNPNRYYYSAFVNKVKEYRIHCAHGKILNFLEKPNPKNGSIAWNRARNGGEAFENVKWDDYNFNCGIEALKACKALKLDFSGIDVLLDEKGVAWVLEANTSPTLASSEYSMQRYGMYFDWLFRKNEKREHWDFTKFEKAGSLAWKNYQLKDEQQK